jgi:hypothetical protein
MMAEGYWEHVEPFWKVVSIYDGPKVFLRRFTEIPEHSGHLLAAHWCSSEVYNGGFHQFFCNDTGVLAPEARFGFEAIGMPQTAAVVAEAMSRLGEPYPRDRERRQDMFCAIDPDGDDNDDWQSPFDDLDGRFYKLTENENGGMEDAVNTYAAQFAVPKGPLRGSGLLDRLLALLRN